MKIQFKLILIGFTVIAVLMAVVGFVGIRGAQKVTESFSVIAHETAPALLALGKIEASLHNMGMDATSFALIVAEQGVAAAAAAEISELEEAKEELEKWEDEYAKIADDEIEKGFVEEIEKHAVALYNAALVLIRAKQDGKGGQEILDLNKGLEEIDMKFEEAIHKAIEHEKNELLEQDKTADAAAAAARNILIVGTITSIFLALGMGIFVSRSVAKPLKELQDAAEAIAKGDLTKRAEVHSQDEIGRIAVAFNTMVESLIVTRKLPENIIRSMADSLMVITPEAKIKEVNQATLDLLGYGREELMGQPVEKVFGRAAAAAAAAAETIFRGAGLEKLMKEGSIKDKEMTYQTKKGEKIPVSVSGSVMRDEKSKPIGIVVSAKDMREIQRLQKETLEILEKSKTELEQKVKERTVNLDAANQQLKATNQLQEATNQELAAAQKQLQDKMVELERFNKITMGREMRILELKEEIGRLKDATAKPIPKITDAKS